MSVFILLRKMFKGNNKFHRVPCQKKTEYNIDECDVSNDDPRANTTNNRILNEN